MPRAEISSSNRTWRPARPAGALKRALVELRDDGSIGLNQEYFTYCQGLRMTGRGFERLFGGPARPPESKITQREMDLARSVQEATEEAMLRIARFAHRETGLEHLTMAGGVALNCVGNGRVLREGPFEEIWIQPAASDAGGALGVALAVWHRYLAQPRTSPERAGRWQGKAGRHGRVAEGSAGSRAFDSVGAMAAAAEPPPYADGMKGSFLGPRFSAEQIAVFVGGRQLPAQRLAPGALADAVAARLASGQVIGLLHGRMEFGPRALGGRSILGDPRSSKMQSVMNLKIKYRESFRPFAPSVMREHVAEWFELDSESPYMLFVAEVRKDRQRKMSDAERSLWGIEKLNVPRSDIPAVTHVDYSARIQTVRRETSPAFWMILEAFYRLTGCPVLVNTSFNVRGEPIVCTPEDAYRCFMRTEMDALVLEEFILDKTEQPAFVEQGDWRREFALD